MDGLRTSRQGSRTSRRGSSIGSSSISISIESRPAPTDTFAVGVLLLLLVVLLWTSSNYVTNYQLTQGYDKPFAVTYLNTAALSPYLIPFAFLLKRRKSDTKNVSTPSEQPNIWTKMGFYLPRGTFWRSETSYTQLSGASDIDEEDAGAGDPLSRMRQSTQRPSSIDGRRPRETMPVVTIESAPPLDLHETAVLAAQFMIVWFLANFFLNVALKLTSVASATTLSSASGFFTLALGAAVGVEAFSGGKLLAVAMSFFGVMMVTRADSSSGMKTADNPYAGDLLSLASAFLYAVYVTLLKKRVGDESRVSMPLFFGMVGLLNLLLMWPVGLLLHVTGLEVLELPQGNAMWAGVLGNMAMSFVSDMAYLLAMLKSSPLVATVGLSLTIPLALLVDLMRGTHTGGSQSYWGSLLVLFSFVAIGIADRSIAARIYGSESEPIDRDAQQRPSRTRT